MGVTVKYLITVNINLLPSGPSKVIFEELFSENIRLKSELEKQKTENYDLRKQLRKATVYLKKRIPEQENNPEALQMRVIAEGIEVTEMDILLAKQRGKGSAKAKNLLTKGAQAQLFLRHILECLIPVETLATSSLTGTRSLRPALITNPKFIAAKRLAIKEYNLIEGTVYMMVFSERIRNIPGDYRVQHKKQMNIGTLEIVQ